MSDVFQESDALKSATETALKRMARLNVVSASLQGRVRAYRDMVARDMPKATILKIMDDDIANNDSWNELPLP
jgi:hypothetical protein